MGRPRNVVTDRAHHLAADSKVVKVDPAPRHCADDAQQPQPSCCDPAGDIALPGRQIVALRVAFGSRPAVNELVVMEHPRGDQLQIEVAEHDVGVVAGDLRKRVVYRLAVVLERPRLDPPADRIVLLRDTARVLERVRAATLDLNLRPLPHGHGAFRNRALTTATVGRAADGTTPTPGET